MYLVKTVRTYFNEYVYTPLNILEAMGMGGGKCNLQALMLLQDIELNTNHSYKDCSKKRRSNIASQMESTHDIKIDTQICRQNSTNDSLHWKKWWGGPIQKYCTSDKIIFYAIQARPCSKGEKCGSFFYSRWIPTHQPIIICNGRSQDGRSKQCKSTHW